MTILVSKLRWTAIPLAGVLCAALQAGANAKNSTTADCQSLVDSGTGHTTIVSAVWVDEAAPVPAHCLVEGFVETGNPAVGLNHVNFRAWLPVPWNGKFHMQGGGGFAGNLPFSSAALLRNYVDIGTDTGHQAGGLDASWAQDNPTAVIDFGYRAIHVTAVAGKRLVHDFYKTKPSYSYFEGCSRGGGQAMMESQRYPLDFDGIIARAPAYNWTGFMTGFANGQQFMYPDPNDLSTPTLPLAKLPVLEALVDANCDTVDGIADGIIDDPRQCTFDPDVDIPVCPENTPNCLTMDEIEAVKAVYEGPSNSKGQVHPGFPLGNEGNSSGWALWIVGAENQFGPGIPNLHYGFADSFFRYMAFADNDDGSFGLHDFDLENYDDLQPIGKILNATDTDLRRFARHGKIIYWNGWSDAAITALGTIQYFEALSGGPQQSVDEFARLYLAPGVQHCGGGEGPSESDLLTELEDWVEGGIPPAEVVATNSVTGMTRPLCPYPQVARYDGSGSTDDAENFDCVNP